MYKANYGYSDGLGDFYLVVNAGKCDGCGDCVSACPKELLEVILDDYDQQVVKVKDMVSKKIGYLCNNCESADKQSRYACEAVCKKCAISHSW